ncbi:MAG TPA: hypothetical protein VHC90_19995 [Bryobacteraceae bacterium]|nr:hypothetical protein [Bryobacteraceae bacterium]
MSPESDNRYIWHETIQTQHTRRSFLSEVAPDVLETVREWLKSEAFDLPMGYRCVIVYRSEHCLEAEVYTGNGQRLVRIGVAAHARCGTPLWRRLQGAPGAKPAEPWCGIWLDYPGLIADPAAQQWLGDFERCLAWAFLAGGA